MVVHGMHAVINPASQAIGDDPPSDRTPPTTPRTVSAPNASDMNWHLALAYFKLAVILEGIHYRYLQGQTVGEGFEGIGEGFDLIIAAGLQALAAQ